jgi:ADP-heptose:LPS heptosyltransferase
MNTSTALHAHSPAVIYTSGGAGDHILALPALRALTTIFPEKLTLICVEGSARIFFEKVAVRRTLEVETFRDGGRIVIQAIPDQDIAKRRANVGSGNNVFYRGPDWTFDADAVARNLTDCDLLISMTPWHSPAADRLLEILSPPHSIGFSNTFQTALESDLKQHLADVFFKVPRALDSSLKAEDYVGSPFLHTRHREMARQFRNVIPPEFRVLIVHADTLPYKMWLPERFATVLDRLLEHHRDLVAFVVGRENLQLDSGRHSERIIPCLPLDLATSLALVAEADFFLGIDSCMLHCADIQLIPGVGLFGPTDPATYGFRFASHRHVYGQGTMDGISVDDVLDAVEPLLNDALKQ